MSTRTKVNEPSSKQFNCSWHGETHVCRNSRKFVRGFVHCECELPLRWRLEIDFREREPRGAETEILVATRNPRTEGSWERQTTHTRAGDVEMTWNYLVQSNHKSPLSVLFLILLPFTLANYGCDGFTFFPVKNKHVFKLFCSLD